MQNTEPKAIQNIICEVMSDIENRNNVKYYAPKLQRETATVEPAPMRKFDYEVGDFVQIRANAKNNIGRIGLIIGVRFKDFENGPALVYTVKFSNKEAADFVPDHFNFIRSAEPGEI